MNIAFHMQRAGQSFGERPAVAIGPQVVRNYSESADRVARLAGAFATQLKLQPGDRVGLAMKNNTDYVEIEYACWHAGLVVVPINAKLHPADFDYILRQSGCGVCLTSADLTESIATLAVPCVERVIDITSADYHQLLAAPAIPIVARDGDDPAWVFFTSGTTGKPKGATLTHRNLLAMICCYFADVDQGGPWNAWLHAAPISHGSGCYGLAHVTQASCLVLPESGGFDPAEVFDIINHWPALSTFAAPTMVKRLIDYSGDTDTRNLKSIIYGGGPMYLEDCQQAIARFGPKLGQLYGQGESPMTITALSVAAHGDVDHPRYLQRLASAGIAQSVMQVAVVDDAGQHLPTGELGEIICRGECVMRGYWNNPEATEKALIGGWLYTGDVGIFDTDGFLTLKDRSKDMIISGGTNIYPREIEEVMLQHPAISEVSVIGRPDREWGETVVAYIVPHQPGGLNTATIDDYCLEHMARFKRPRDYRFVDSLPKNNYGKVLKTELRDKDQESS